MACKTIRAAVPMLAVRDMTRSVAFYERLGFSALRYNGGDGYAFLQRDGRELHLSQSNDAGPGSNPGSGVYFFLESHQAAKLQAEFQARGVAVLSPLAVRDWKMNEFVLADPDGNLLRFGESAVAVGQPSQPPAIDPTRG